MYSGTQLFQIPATKQRSINKTQKFVSDGFKYNCHHGYNEQPYTLALDWLQYAAHFKVEGVILGTDIYKQGFRMLYQGHGTQHYKHLYHVYYGNEMLFVLELSPRKSKDESIGLLKFENHVLYGLWYEWHYKFSEAFITDIIRISRVDIALDGLNNVRELLADWLTPQLQHNYKLLGKSVINGYNFNRITKKPEGFRIGSIKGNKQISIYNKTKEIKKGNKPYIKKHWERNGLTIPEVYRFECRMKNGFLTRVILSSNKQKLTSAEMLIELQSPAFCLSMVHLFIKGFFEFKYMDDKNVTRCKPIKFLPENTFNMERTPLEKRPTNYKAKLTIHNMYQQCITNKVNTEDALKIMSEQLRNFELWDWYANKLQDFQRLYITTDGKLINSLSGLAYGKPREQKLHEYAMTINADKILESMTALAFDYTPNKKNNKKGNEQKDKLQGLHGTVSSVISNCKKMDSGGQAEMWC